MKFVHCADVHLDSPLRGLARYPGAPEDRLRRATRDAFEKVVALAIAERAAFVVIAGDLYDGDRDDFQTAVYLQHQLHVLVDSGIPVVIAYGNHDAANEITRRLDPPAGVHVFGHDTAGSHVLEAAGAVLHGRSYATRSVVENLSASYPAPLDGLLNVGVLHTSLDGRAGHDPYAPCTPGGLVQRGYGYWALGHVHAREHHQLDGVHIVFPGNVQGRDVGEIGPKGATVVEYDAETVRSVVHRSLAPVQWADLRVDAGAARSVDAVLARVLEEIDALRGGEAGGEGVELHAVRVRVAARADVAEEWRRGAERFEAQLRSDACGSGDDVWMERVQVVGSAGGDAGVGFRDPGLGDDAVDAVRDAIARLRGDSAESLAARAELFGLLTSVRTKFGLNVTDAIRAGAEALDPAALCDVLGDVEALLVAELRA